MIHNYTTTHIQDIPITNAYVAQLDAFDLATDTHYSYWTMHVYHDWLSDTCILAIQDTNYQSVTISDN